MTGSGVGDRTEQWRGSYRQVRKDPLMSSVTTNRRRLASVGAHEVGQGARWVDVGAGDGNLAPQLFDAGAGWVVSVDYQLELICHAPAEVERVVGSAVQLPINDRALDVAVVMDLLHHLEPAQLRPALDELHRVLRPGGHLLLFEPVDTATRRVLAAALMSPLAGLTPFSRRKRQMVEQEAATLTPWLRGERGFSAVLEEAGFSIERHRRGPLHGAYRCRST